MIAPKLSDDEVKYLATLPGYETVAAIATMIEAEPDRSWPSLFSLAADILSLTERLNKARASIPSNALGAGGT